MQETFLYQDQFFDLWNEEKKKLHKERTIVYPKTKEIWLIKLGLNIGKEQNGKGSYLRPVLVYKKLRGFFLCIPLTTKGRHPKYHYKLTNTNKPSYLAFNQIRCLDAKRFLYKMREISEEEFLIIKKLLYQILFDEKLYGSETDHSPVDTGSEPKDSISES